MGITLFMPLGQSPGALTSPLAYFKYKIEYRDTLFFGGIPRNIQNIVIFTTPEIKSGKLKSYPYINNEFLSSTAQEKGNNNSENVIDIILEFIRSELGVMLNSERGNVFYCQASANKVEDNLKALARAILYLSPPGKTGREIWMNVTGGTNIMNISVLLAACLSGLVARIYYTFVPREDQKFLCPTARFEWIDLPCIKIGFDEEYYEVLEILRDIDTYLSATQLLGRLKSLESQYFQNMPLQTFIREFLNKLDGQGLIERKNETNKLSWTGKKLLDLLDEELIRDLVLRGKSSKILSIDEAELEKFDF